MFVSRLMTSTTISLKLEVGWTGRSPPLLFNLVANVFTRMLIKSTICGHVAGLFQQLRLAGVISMQFAHDTLIFLENSLESIKNCKLIVYCFEQISGMRTNFHKFELVPINIVVDEAQPFAQTLCCRINQLPIKYLGVPLHHSGRLTKRI